MSAFVTLGAAAKPAGGAPLDQLIAITAVTSIAMLLVVWLVVVYRRGGAPRLRRLEVVAERYLRLPGWAALPGLGAVACSAVTISGATWDIGLHIDVGRDSGPLGTTAHYPLLLGLFGAFLMGILAVGMAPQEGTRSSRAAVTFPRPIGRVPAAAALLFAGGAFAMLAFPLDDLWHRVFGQDVTLWGPTHVMIIAGTAAAGIGGVALLIEGARASGHDPFRGRGLLRRPLPGLLGGVFLYLWAATVHEFNWGVPQFRLVWHPLILAFGAAQALVLVRVLAGRGATVLALAVWLPLQIAMTAAIGGPLDVTPPGMPLFVAEALLIELLALRGVRSPLRFGALAGLAVGTVGFAAEYGWTHLVMPVPWPPELLAEGLPVAIAAGLAGGVLGALMAQALTGSLARGRGPLAGAVLCIGAFVALGVNATITSTPAGATATMTLENVRSERPSGGRTPVQVADLTVRLTGTDVDSDPLWASALAWQGGGRYLDHLERGADGAWRTDRPVPIGGDWKSFVRFHGGRTMLAAPVRMPRDAEIGFAGYPAQPTATRALVPDQKLLQIERKSDAPLGLWLPAIGLVLGLVLAIVAAMGVVMARIGRLAVRPPSSGHPPGRGQRERRPARPEREAVGADA